MLNFIRATILVLGLVLPAFSDKKQDSRDQYNASISEIPVSDTDVFFNDEIETTFSEMTIEQRNLLKKIAGKPGNENEQ